MAWATLSGQCCGQPGAAAQASAMAGAAAGGGGLAGGSDGGLGLVVVVSRVVAVAIPVTQGWGGLTWQRWRRLSARFSC